MLFEIFQYKFLTNAIIISLLTSISCGIIGTYIVSRRIVFISGGITHASFGGIGLGYFLGMSPILGAAIFAVLSALGIEYASHRTQIRQDSVIGIMWSFGMALGIIFVYLTPGYAPDLMSYLFGSILTVSTGDIQAMGILAIVVSAFFILFSKKILFMTFDQEYASTHNLPIRVFQYILIALVALTIVLNIRVVGIILVISLLSVPPTIANLFTHNYRSIIVWSIVIALVSNLSGLYISYVLDIPSGASIIFTLVMFFVITKLISKLINNRKPNNLKESKI